MKKEEGPVDKVVTRTLIILLMVLSFEVFFFFYLLLPFYKFSILVDSFNKIAVGISALAAVIFGPTLASRELEKDRKIRSI